MVFQNYALYPHLTVYENLEFGMKIRKVSKVERDKKVKWASNILGLDEYLKKKPKDLSGGQRQRVALGRAIVREPKLFLMDEPLSNLDAKLKYNMCSEIKNLHKKLNATTIYVTHDQTEAMTIADKIVVLDEGKIQQISTPKEVYSCPNNIFVAKFLGRPEINLFNAKIEKDKVVLEESIEVAVENIKENTLEKEYILGIRPEDIELDDKGIKVNISKIHYLGGEVILDLYYKNINFTMKTNKLQNINEGDKVGIKFNFNNMSIFNKETKENIKKERY